MYHHTSSANDRNRRMRFVCINAIIGHMQSIAFGEKACRRFSYRHILCIGRIHTTYNAHCTPHHDYGWWAMGTQYAYVESITTHNNDKLCEQFNAMDHGPCWSKATIIMMHFGNAATLRILFWMKRVHRN